MPAPTREGALQEAREELRRYLSDEIAPMMAADSVAALVRHPENELQDVLQAWVDSQVRRPGQHLGSADFVYHALRKLLELTELSLVPEGPLLARIEEAGKRFLSGLPGDQAHLLSSYLAELSASDSALSARVEVLHRPASAAGAHPAQVPGGAPNPASAAGSTSGTFRVQSPASPAPADYGASLQRLGAIMGRLEQRLAAVSSAGDEREASAAIPEAATHAISSAAAGARSAQELDALLERLERMGIDTRLDQLFKSLGEQVPGWTLAGDAGEAQTRLPQSRSLKAMQRLVDLAEDDAEISRRLHQLVSAAVERVQAGALAPAVKMFDLAEEVASERELSGETFASICSAAGKALSPAGLFELSEDQEQHSLLRRVLAFFPHLRVGSLLTRLQEAERREERYQLLALTRVHGPGARSAICDQLRACCDGDIADPDGFFRRNLVFLLRRIPPDSRADRSDEYGLLERCARPEVPLIVAKETIGALCGSGDEEVERILVQTLKDLEKALLAANRTGHSPEELRDLLDRVASSLAQRSSVASARHVANHALRSESELGDALARVATLGSRDLGEDADLVRALVAHLEAALPKKVLGVVMARELSSIAPLVKALSGTFHPEARRILEEIATRFPGRDFGELAAKALRRSVPAAPSLPESPDGEERPAASPSLDGDLGLFGLPNLLQSLSGSRVTGRLVLCDAGGNEIAAIELSEGLLMRCFASGLEGEIALFQLLERPVPGRFHFTSDPGAAEGEAHLGQPIDPLALVLEGLRRHDELQLALALVPDGARFDGTDQKPTLPENTSDRERAREIWHLARSGELPEQCERRLALDAFTVRSLVSHWVEEGALAARPADA